MPSKKSSPDESNDDCVVANPIPPAEIGHYSPSRDPDSEQDIARYVEYESRQHVQHTELVKTEFVHGVDYEIWDVITENDRWWVITNITNLYSQKHFPSLDYTLSFHIGLMMRMSDRPYQREARGPHPFEAVFRRHDQASEHLDRAKEVQDYQAVGMELRECLLAMITPMKSAVALREEDRPKDADFKAWADAFIQAKRPGASFKELRAYLRGNAEKIWNLVNCLTHYQFANEVESSISFGACGTLIGDFSSLLDLEVLAHLENCPDCGSKNVRTHYDVRIKAENKSYQTCGVCPWNTHPLGDERSFETSALDLLHSPAET